MDINIMEIPDVAGFALGKARILLDEAGIEICRIVATYPPRQRSIDYDENFRVIRLKMVENKTVELLVCKPL